MFAVGTHVNVTPSVAAAFTSFLPLPRAAAIGVVYERHREGSGAAVLRPWRNQIWAAAGEFWGSRRDGTERHCAAARLRASPRYTSCHEFAVMRAALSGNARALL